MRSVIDGPVTSLHSCKSISRRAGQFSAKDMIDRSVTWEIPLSFNCKN